MRLAARLRPADLPARVLLFVLLVLGACAPLAPRRGPATPLVPPEEAQAQVERLLPTRLADRAGWAADIRTAFTALGLPLDPRHLCAAIAVAEQESGLVADPPVPGLPRIARAEIDRRAAAFRVPRLVVSAALMTPSLDGTSYGERLEKVRTEGQLSAIFEEMAARVPLGGGFLATRNPVRTGGSMQVSIAFAEAEAKARTYPYPVATTIRREVFSRRGGLYFGIAHLLAYPADYPSDLYRFADYNAGRWASRNAAFQRALSRVSGIALVPDGDLLVEGTAPGATERAARAIAPRLGLDPEAAREDLDKGTGPGFLSTDLAKRVFAEADRMGPSPAPRAIVPTIRLAGPKISRPLTTAWFADRVADRQRACLARA